MRIRKNRTSSRVGPEYCVAYALEKMENIKHVDASQIDSPLPQPSIPTIRKPPLLDVDELELDAAAILNSLDNESLEKIKIRDFVLAQGANARPGGSENRNGVTGPRQSGSESDTGHLTGSTKMIVKQDGVGSQPQSASASSHKMNSDTSSKAMGDEIESRQEPTHAKTEVIDDLPPKQQQTTATVVDSGSSRSVVGSRKRPRRQVESDSSRVQKEIADTKLEDDDYMYAAAPKFTAEKTAGKPVGKEGNVQLQGKETAEKTPPSSFPAGWSYRGLAQIAERDKTAHGKPCGRTDGRSWRCPLRVQEGFTLCAHHLKKFRLKKLCKGNKKRKASPRQCRRQQKQEEEEEEEHEEQQQQPTTPPSPPLLQIDTSKTVQTPTTMEHDMPMKFRRRHKTVKLSVL